MGNIRLGAKIRNGGENRQRRGQVHVAQSGLLGGTRHLATRYLWHQDVLKDGLFQAERCESKDNPVDVGTKVLDSETRERLLGVLCIVSRAATGYASIERAESVGSAFCSGQGPGVQTARAHCGTVLTSREEIHGVGMFETVFVTLAVMMFDTCSDVHMSERDGSATAWISTSWVVNARVTVWSATTMLQGVLRASPAL